MTSAKCNNDLVAEKLIGLYFDFKNKLLTCWSFEITRQNIQFTQSTQRQKKPSCTCNLLMYIVLALVQEVGDKGANEVFSNR